MKSSRSGIRTARSYWSRDADPAGGMPRLPDGYGVLMTTTPQEPAGDPQIVPSGEPQDPYVDPVAPDTEPAVGPEEPRE